MATVKTAISLDAELFREAQEAARNLGITRSRLFTLALREFLAQQENRQLLERLNAACDAAASVGRNVPVLLRRKHRSLVVGTW